MTKLNHLMCGHLLPIAAAGTLLSAPDLSAAAEPVRLITDGEATAVVVLPEQTELDRYLAPTDEEIDRVVRERLPRADEALLAAARKQLPAFRKKEAEAVGDDEELALRELIEVIRRISGATLPVVRPEPGQPLPAGTKILLGTQVAIQAGVGAELAQLDRDGYLIKTVGDSLIVSGRRARGTLYAVYALLESLGCRWVMPGPAGELYPSLSTIETTIDVVANPSHHKRYWWCTYGNADDYPRWTLRNRGDFVHAIGDQRIAQGHHLSGALRWGSKRKEISITVTKRVRQAKRGADGQPLTDESGRRVTEWVEKEVQRLPDEYYAMSNGSILEQVPNMANPKVWDLYAEYYIELFNNNPFVDYASVSAEDGLVDDERPESRELDSYEYDRFISSYSATDRLWFFLNRVIERVVKVHPKRKFGVLVYANNTQPPRLEHVHPNMALVFAPLGICPLHHVRDDKCKTNRQYAVWLQAWMAQARAAGAETYYYDYEPLGYQWNPMMICPRWSIIGRNYPWFAELGLTGHTTQGFDSWGTSFFDHWLMIRLYWDADQDYRQLLADLAQTCFGAAAPEMLAYCSLLEARMAEIPDLCSNEVWGNHLVLTPALRAACREVLQRAAAAADTERAKQFVQLIVDLQRSTDAFCDGIEHARDTADFAAAAKLLEPAFAIRDRLNEVYPHFIHPTITEQTGRAPYQPGGWYRKYLVWDAKIKGAAASLALPRYWQGALDTDNVAWTKGWQRPEVSVADLEALDTTVVPDVKYQTQRDVAAFFYRTDVEVPDAFAGPGRTVLYFPSLIARAVQIWIDGEPVMFERDGVLEPTWRGPRTFWMNYDHQAEFDVTGMIKPGAVNTVAVRVFKSFDHGGSYDRIFLLRLAEQGE